MKNTHWNISLHLLCIVLSVAYTSCSATFVNQGYGTDISFFKALNLAGAESTHELVRVGGVRDTGTQMYCDVDTCRWIGMDSLNYALPHDSISEVRFHSKWMAFQKAAPWTVVPSFLFGATYGALTASNSFIPFVGPASSDSAIKYGLIWAGAGLALSALIALADGQGPEDSGYTVYVFREPQPRELQPNVVQPPPPEPIKTRRSRGKKRYGQ